MPDPRQQDREMWALGDYRLIAERLMPAGERIVAHVGAGPGDEVLDVACGTGVAALPAARAGARVAGLDLSPELLDLAAVEAQRAGVEVTWVVGDAEALPFEDERFDVVVSTFGSMFAPRHRVAAAEQVRVLRPGGRMGLCCWTPEGFVTDFFETVGSFRPPAPDGGESALLWGSEAHVRELFAGTGVALAFERETIDFRFPSTAAAVDVYLANFGPVALVRRQAERDGRVDELRAAMAAMFDRQRTTPGDELAFEGEYLVTLGRKAAAAPA